MFVSHFQLYDKDLLRNFSSRAKAVSALEKSKVKSRVMESLGGGGGYSSP